MPDGHVYAPFAQRTDKLVPRDFRGEGDDFDTIAAGGAQLPENSFKILSNKLFWLAARIIGGQKRALQMHAQRFGTGIAVFVHKLLYRARRIAQNILPLRHQGGQKGSRSLCRQRAGDLL